MAGVCASVSDGMLLSSPSLDSAESASAIFTATRRIRCARHMVAIQYRCADRAGTLSGLPETGHRFGDKHGVCLRGGQLDRDPVDGAGSWWRYSVFDRHASCQGSPVRHDPLVHCFDRGWSRIKFSRFSLRQTGEFVLSMDVDIVCKRSPALFSRCDADFRIGFCVRSLYGDDVSASPLDRSMGWTHLGGALFAMAKLGDGYYGSCH